jgi:hypothetical protein
MRQMHYFAGTLLAFTLGATPLKERNEHDIPVSQYFMPRGFRR